MLSLISKQSSGPPFFFVLVVFCFLSGCSSRARRIPKGKDMATASPRELLKTCYEKKKDANPQAELYIRLVWQHFAKGISTARSEKNGNDRMQTKKPNVK